MTAEPQPVATETPLDITDLEIRYPGRREPSLRGIGLEVSAGERVAVAGRTGAGKSTLALAAAGFIPRVVRATVNGAVTSPVSTRARPTRANSSAGSGSCSRHRPTSSPRPS